MIDRIFTVNHAQVAPGNSWLCAKCKHLVDAACRQSGSAELFQSGIPDAGAAFCSHYKKTRRRTK